MTSAVTTFTFSHVAHAVEGAPANETISLRMPLQMELGEIKAAIDRCLEKDRDIIVKGLILWHEETLLAINHDDYRRLPITHQVVKPFIRLLAKELHLIPGAPLSPELFGELPPEVVKLVANKLQDSHSIFYSEDFVKEAASAKGALQKLQKKKATAAALKKFAPKAFKKLAELQAKDMATQQFTSGIATELKEASEKVDKRCAALAEKIAEVAKEQVKDQQEFDAIFEEAQKKHRQEVTYLKHAAVALEAQSRSLQARAEALQEKLDRDNAILDEVDRANINNELRANEVEQKLNRQKSGWLHIFCSAVFSIGMTLIAWFPIYIPPEVFDHMAGTDK